MTLYIENLSFLTLLQLFHKNLRVLHTDDNGTAMYYYIDATQAALKLAKIIGRFFGSKFEKLQFTMMDIKDENGEFVRIRIARKDLFKFEKLIRKSNAYKELFNDRQLDHNLELFITKGILFGGIHHAHMAPSRMLYLINVVKWHMELNNFDKVSFFIKKRSWFNEYSKIAKKFGIELYEMDMIESTYGKLKQFLSRIVKRNTRLLIVARNIQNKTLFNLNNKSSVTDPLLFLEGRGDINFENNGYHSDFFWQLNSKFSTKDILYKCFSEEKDILIANGVQCIERRVKYYKTKFIMPKIERTTRYKKEREEINNQILFYKSIREYWLCLFKTYNVKIYSTWNSYDNDHMAKSDAINDLGGISIVQQIAFDGYKTYESSINADIVFRYSKWICDNEKELNSKIKYKIITGYPKDYANPLLKEEALIRRNWLKNNGAKKIVFVIDENSGNDERWHTGHNQQKENYSFILNKMMETPWLGVIFKPKNAKTLRKRLGEEIWKLLIEAQNTGRCYIYTRSGRYTTSVPPLLAGLSADICVHGHMGNAALECALNNLPTLVLDREGNPNHKFRQLPDNKVVFYNWPDTIDAIIEYFKQPKGHTGFGDWSKIIDEFDPFRDGKAANRIGSLKSWLIEGFKQGMNKEIILNQTVERYVNRWGNDKVVIGNN